MSVLEGLKPEIVFKHFENLCGIPHGSYQEKAVSDYCVAVGKRLGLETYQDDLYNVVIIKEAAPGCEAEEPIILQAHLDMVCEKEKDADIDFARDGLDLFVDRDQIGARGTTLGGDDGIGVAMGLALLEEDLSFPRLEVVFTVSEEVGMEGAKSIDLSMLKGRRMLNLDSEEEGCFLTGCAGGMTLDCRFLLEREEKEMKVWEIEISGLQGGHSGTEIHREHGNANVLMARFLRTVSEKFLWISMDGGLKDNAIPRTCKALLGLPCQEMQMDREAQEALANQVKDFDRTLKKEFFASDGGVCVALREKGIQRAQAVAPWQKKDLFAVMAGFPNGVQAWCQAVPDTVETSVNMGIVTTTKEALCIRFSLRSSVESRKEELAARIEAVAALAKGSTEVTGAYPAWEYRPQSELRELAARIYRQMYGKEAILCTIHAGLECGLLTEKIPGLDCLSLGPDIADIHTPKERLSIASTCRVYDFVKKLLVAK